MIILIIITILANLIIIILIKIVPTEKKPAVVNLPCNFLAGSSWVVTGRFLFCA